MTHHGENHGVKITVDIGPRSGRIRLQGQLKDVYQVENYVREMLHKEKEFLQELEKAVLISQLVSTNWDSIWPAFEV